MANYGGYPPGYGMSQPQGYGQPVAGAYGAGYGYAPAGQPGWPGAPAGIDPNVYQWFQAVDLDKSGRISVPELQQALTNANWTRFNTDTCRLMIAMFDRDRSGQIDMNEFQALWTYIHQWRTIFDQFDRDRSGSIDANELNNAYMQLGYRMSPQFAQGVVYRYDPVGRQRLTLDNFIQSCVLLKSFTDSFRARDSGSRGVIQIGYEDFVSAVMLNRI